MTQSKYWKAIASVTLLLAALLIFIRLGHYSLWDDETMVALVAKGVMMSGDTSAVIDHGNVVAYRAGLLLHDLHDRSTPPLATYVTAASFSLFGINSWSARLPFAVMGLATIALLLYWARKAKTTFLLLFSIGLLCNVSLMLYFRQCRYYAPSILFAVAAAYLYWNWNGNRRQLILLSVCSILLFASNYLICFILYCCLLIDYLIWKRRERPLKPVDWAVLLGPQIVFSGLLAWIWSPFKTGQGGYATANSFYDKLTLFWWLVRDLNACEFYTGLLLILSPIVALVWRRKWMLRGWIALLLFISVGAFVSPQTVLNAQVADVRYFGPIIPLAVAIGAGVIYCLLGRWPAIAVAAGCLAFGSTLLHWTPTGFRSTLALYLRELANPPAEPYGPTADWINRNIPEGGTVHVVPDYALYPLMFHAPKARYVWQLEKPEGQFESFPPIDFKNNLPPDYLIGFGPATESLAAMQLPVDQPIKYDLVGVIPVFWKDLYRPELFWRIFTPILQFNPDSESVYIFKRTL